MPSFQWSIWACAGLCEGEAWEGRGLPGVGRNPVLCLVA